MNQEHSRLALDAISHEISQMCRLWLSEVTRPSVVFKPIIMQDGNMFIALLGNNIQEGVVGCGDTPEAAMWVFDRAWGTKAQAALRAGATGGEDA